MFWIFGTAISQIFFLLSYVSTANSFPKPLSAKDEQYYLQRFAQGDIEARNILIEKNLRLVAHVAKKYNSTNNDPDDLISIGTIGLIKAINTFDYKKGIRLATYAARCIDNEILMVIRNGKKLQNEVSFDEPIGTDKEGNEINLMDIVSNHDDEVIEAVEFNMQVKKLYNAIDVILTDREKTVINLRYGLNNRLPKTQREIAKELNISRSYVSRIEKKAVKKLAKFFRADHEEIQ